MASRKQTPKHQSKPAPKPKPAPTVTPAPLQHPDFTGKDIESKWIS